MRIGIAGQFDVEPVRGRFAPGVELPRIFSGPFTGELATAYLEHGHEVSVFGQYEKYGKFETRKQKGRDIELNILSRGRPRSTVLSLWKREITELALAIKDSEVDVVHAHWANEFALGAIASGKPAIVTLHEVPSRAFLWLRPRWYWFAKSILSKRVAMQAKVLVANSPYTFEKWRPSIPANSKFVTIPNAVPAWVTELPGRAGASDKTSPVFSAANHFFTKLKNTSNILLAFAEVRRTIPGAVLRLYGAEHEADGPANRWAIERRCDGGVEFRGIVPHRLMLQEVVSSGGVVVHASLEESFGLFVAEAQTLGIPVVGGKSSGAVPWLLEGGKAGTLCDVLSTAELAKAMIDALGAEAAQKASYARERAKTLYSYPRMVDDYLRLLNTTAGEVSFG